LRHIMVHGPAGVPLLLLLLKFLPLQFTFTASCCVPMNNNIMLLTTGALVLLSASAPLPPPADAFSAPRPVPVSSPVGGQRRRRRIRPQSCTMGAVASNDDAATAATTTTMTLTTTAAAAAMLHPLLSDHPSVTPVLSCSIQDATSSALLSRKRMRSPDGDDVDDAASPPDDDDVRSVEAGLAERRAAEDGAPTMPPPSFAEGVLNTRVGPRLVLGLVAVLYGTNFPLGAIMNDNLPASAATSSRMVLASLVLSPFLSKLAPALRLRALLGGAFVSLGYISQSAALVDTSPALVSFLGSATVLVCPALQWLVDGRPMGIKDAPQTWLVRRFPLPSPSFSEAVWLRPFSR
jgi:hypothetical protein